MTVSLITSDQEDNFDSIIDVATKRAFKEINPGKEGLQRLFERGGEWQDYFVDGIRRYCAPAPDYALAKKILGGDFVTPEEVMAKRPVVYTDEQVLALSETLPSEDVLRALKEEGFALVAAPPTALSLLDVRLLKAGDFYSKTGGWYNNDNQKFSRDDKTSFGWLAVRKAPVTDSLNKSWEAQSELLSDVEHVPNAAEMNWFITTFLAVRGVRLFKRFYVRTSSLSADGDRVGIGGFDSGGLDFHNYWDNRRDSDLGVASVRKF